METLIRYIVDDQFSKINTNLVNLQKSMDSLKTEISIIKKNQDNGYSKLSNSFYLISA